MQRLGALNAELPDPAGLGWHRPPHSQVCQPSSAVVNADGLEQRLRNVARRPLKQRIQPTRQVLSQVLASRSYLICRDALQVGLVVSGLPVGAIFSMSHSCKHKSTTPHFTPSNKNGNRSGTKAINPACVPDGRKSRGYFAKSFGKLKLGRSARKWFSPSVQALPRATLNLWL